MPGWQWSAAEPDSAKELGRVGRCDAQARSSGGTPRRWETARPPAAVYANQVQVHVLALRNAELEQTAAAWSRNWRRWKRQ